jgi:hypothetical protein
MMRSCGEDPGLLQQRLGWLYDGTAFLLQSMGLLREDED